MSTQLQNDFITAEEYLRLERAAEFKSEYYNGVIYAMAGARRKHVRIVTSIIYVLESQLRERDCNVYTNDLRVCVDPVKGLYTYPDTIVTCGEEKYLDNQFDTLLNPVTIIEVLSESTAKYDQSAKFELYAEVESLKEYVLVAQNRVSVSYFSRQPEGKWLLTSAQKLSDTLHFGAIDCQLKLTDVYAKVDVKEGFEALTEEDIKRLKGKTYYDE